MKNYLAEQGGISEGNVCMTDGTFFEDMRAKERKILEEIDPEGLKELDRIDAERKAQESDEEESEEKFMQPAAVKEKSEKKVGI